ncbi:MAG: DUF6602 domain-containing protein [Thermoanaerobaculia bacterium]
MEKLVEILRAEAKTISEEFRKASSLGEGTSQEVAEFRENAFRAFLGRFYPAPYRVVKGKIHDSFGNGPSASIDSILVNPVHPHLIDSFGKFQLLLADGVDVAIEIKPDLSSTSELQRGLQQGVTVKQLRRAIGPILLPKRKPERVVQESLRVPYFVFAEKTWADLPRLVRETESWYATNTVPPENQIDAFVILDIGVIRRVKHPDF